MRDGEGHSSAARLGAKTTSEPFISSHKDGRSPLHCVDGGRRRSQLPRLAHLNARDAYPIGQGCARQISEAYSAIVRSLENLPELAILRMLFCAQLSGAR
jgi:hypothetical protein